MPKRCVQNRASICHSTSVIHEQSDLVGYYQAMDMRRYKLSLPTACLVSIRMIRMNFALRIRIYNSLYRKEKMLKTRENN